MADKPILTFDTSAINRLTDDPDSDLLLAGMSAGFYIRSTFESVEEIMATRWSAQRHNLLGMCKRLLTLGGCIDPASVILRKMVASFEGGARFDWTSVGVGLPEAAENISRAEDFTDELSRQVREKRARYNRLFREVYSEAKPHFETVFFSGSGEAPRSPAELIARVPETFWKTSANVYARCGAKCANEATARRFIKECDPFRALMMAFFAAAFDRCARPPGTGSFRSGWGDTLMAVCLAYCDQFVTNDSRMGGQLAFYRQVAALAALRPLTVRSYDEFRAALWLGQRAVRVRDS